MKEWFLDEDLPVYRDSQECTGIQKNDLLMKIYRQCGLSDGVWARISETAAMKD